MSKGLRRRLERKVKRWLAGEEHVVSPTHSAIPRIDLLAAHFGNPQSNDFGGEVHATTARMLYILSRQPEKPIDQRIRYCLNAVTAQ